MSTDTKTEHRLTTVEIKVLEHCQDIKELKEDLHRVEDHLKLDIRANHDLIVKILDNEIPHLREEISNNHKFGGNWDVIKIVGAISGLFASVVLIIQNGSLIMQWLYNVLHVLSG